MDTFEFIVTESVFGTLTARDFMHRKFLFRF